MWNYERRLEYPIRLLKPDARAARVIDSARPIEKTQVELKNMYQQLLRRIG